MNALEILAMVIAVVICALPGIMAWRFYSGSRKRTAEKRQAIRNTQPAEA
jgi:hypothetical protein